VKRSEVRRLCLSDQTCHEILAFHSSTSSSRNDTVLLLCDERSKRFTGVAASLLRRLLIRLHEAIGYCHNGEHHSPRYHPSESCPTIVLLFAVCNISGVNEVLAE
jgi:hypothetical protein